MLTASQRAQWRSARDTLDGHLISTLDRIMATAHGAPGKETKDLILTAIPEVVKAHGTVTAELTAEFYALARTNASLNDLFTPEPVWDPNEQQIAGSLRWALRPINGEQYTGEDYTRAVDRVRAAMTRLMRQTEGTTVMENVRRDPRRPLYRRVPEAGACGWCMMLATRGHVYTKDTVGGPHHRFHDNCKCSSDPQYRGEELPELVQAARKAYYDFYYPDDSGDASPEGLREFFDFVEDGGLGIGRARAGIRRADTVSLSMGRKCRSHSMTYLCRDRGCGSTFRRSAAAAVGILSTTLHTGRKTLTGSTCRRRSSRLDIRARTSAGTSGRS